MVDKEIRLGASFHYCSGVAEHTPRGCQRKSGSIELAKATWSALAAALTSVHTLQ
jgi:hypothetical protein